MAKTGKTGGTAAGSARKTGASKTAKKKTPAAPPSGGPLIDTGLAARAAASMLLNRQRTEETHSGGMLRQIKQDLARPQQTPVGSLLGGAGGAGVKHPQLPARARGAGGASRGGGAAGNRIGLPRRMGGS